MDKSDAPLVSIITPSYNQSAYLESTICSVLAQDYHSIEYLIVDGASTDGSVDIISKYASLCPERLRWWVSEPDSGQAEAINKGFRHASGEIIAWLNSDDIYLPGAVNQAAAALMANPDLGLVYTNAITIDAEGKPLKRLTFGNWGLSELAEFRILCQPAVFIRRSVLEKAGYLDAKYHFMLDHHLWLRMARLSSISHAGDHAVGPWAAARHHPLAKNVSQAERFSAETMRLLTWLKEQSALATPLSTSSRHMVGGAYRLSGRYLLDGGLPSEALRSYGRALMAWPNYALKHWHRMLYALLLAMHLEKLATAIDTYRQKNAALKREHLAAILKDELQWTLDQIPGDVRNTNTYIPSTVDAWPGLNLG